MKNAIKKILAFVLVIAMIAGVLPSVFAADIVEPFTDVKTSDWFADYVEFVYEHEPQLMNGMTETTFVPQGTCTRAMAAVVLYRLEDPVVPSIKPSTFTDLTLDWYKNGIAWAQANGVVNGVTETTFVPEGLVTREQLVTMLWRYAGEPAVNGDFLKDFPDADMVAPYAKEAFNWAISLGIIGGANGYLNPKGNATRAEFAKILYVFIQTNTPCEHKWDDGKVTKPATCIETGIMTYTCKLCGATKEEEIPLGDHSYVDGVCEYCGDKLADKGEIVIYYTNDVHTYIDKALSYDSVADLKQQTAKVADGVLLVDAGDHIQGTAYGSMDKGANIISMMSAAGYDVATLGNHEFDYGMARTLEITKQADYDYLSCNFYNEKNGVRGENVLDAYKIFEIGGKKVALVGVTTPESFTKSTPKYFQDDAGNYIYGIAGGTDGKALYADVQKAIDDAKKDGADYIIALGHLGDDPASDPWNSEDVIKNVSGLNAFIDGHSHSTVETKNVNGKDGKPVVLTQTGQYFDAIGKMTIKDGKITTELITSYDGSDETVAGIKDKWIEEVDGLLGEVFGHTSLTLDNYKGEERLVRKQETNTGDFAADALYYLFDTTEGLDVDVAIMNGGGVRNKAITGDISYKTCKDIHTFGNVACLQTVTGQQILDALEWGAKDAAADGSKENGGFLQVAGLTYEIHTYIPSTVRKDDKNVWTGGPTGEYRVKNVKVWDKASGAYVALDLNAKYNLAGYNYTLRDLGDGFAMFAGAVNVKDFVMEDYMVLANYVKSFAKVSNKHEIIANSTAVPYGSDYSTVNGSGRIVLKNEPEHGRNDFGLLPSLSQLKTGDEVIIYNVGGGKAVPATMQGSYYLAGYDVTPADDKIAEADADASIVWTVTVNSDGTYTFTNGTDVLSINYDASAGKGNLSLDGSNPNLAVVLQSGKTDTFNIYSATQTGKYEHVYLEWYAQFSDFSAYDTGANNAAKADYGYQFYVKGLKDDPPPPPPPITGDTYAKVTSDLGDWAGTYVIAYETSATTAYVFNGTNDADMNYVEAAISDGKIKVSSDCAIVIEKSGSGYTFKAKGGYLDGKMASGVPANGTTFSAEAKVGNVSWDSTNKTALLTSAVGTVMRFNNGAKYEGEGNYAWFRFYKTNSSIQTPVSLYKLTDSPIVEHSYAWNGEVGEDGYHTLVCADCGATQQEACTFEDGFCTVCGAEEPIPSDDDFYMIYDLSELMDGDEVIIYNVGGGKAVPATMQGSYYLAGYDVTPEDEVIAAADADDSIVWTVSINDDGSYTFTNGSSILSINYNGKTSLSLDGANPKLAVVPQSEEDCTFNIYSATLKGSYEHIYLEWYAQFSDFSAYDTGSGNAAKADYGYQFFVRGDFEPLPDPGDADWIVLYNKDSGSIIGYNEETDMNEDTYEYSYWNISTEDVAVSGTKLTADFANAGTFYVIDNGDGTYSFVDQYNYDYGFARYLTAETPDTYYDYTDEYAPFEVIPTTGGYLLRNVEDNSYYAIEDGLVAAKALVRDDPSFVFQFAAVVDIEEVGEEDANLICEIYDSIDDVIFFGETIGDDCKHENTELQGAKTPSCTAAGYTGDLVCLDCGATIEEGTVIGKLNHVDEDKDGYCDVCETEINPDTEEIVIFYPADNKVMTTEEYTYTGKTTKIELVAADATLKDGAVSTEADNVAKFTVVEGDGYVTFATADGKYLYADGTDVKLVDTEGDNTQFVIEEVDGGVYLKCANAQYQGKAQYIEFYSGYFTVYGMGTNTAIYTFELCPLGEAPIPCEHKNTELQGANDATCTAAGYTGDLVCLDCGKTVEKGSSIAPLGHIDENKDDACDRCGADLTTSGCIKVTAEPADWSGTYLIAYDLGDGTAKVFNGTDAVSDYVTASVSNGAIQYADGMAKVTIVKEDGSYYLKVGDQYMITKKASGAPANGIVFSGDKEAVEITFNADGTVKLLCNTLVFRFNTGSAASSADRFRFYKQNASNDKHPMVTLFKVS